MAAILALLASSGMSTPCSLMGFLYERTFKASFRVPFDGANDALMYFGKKIKCNRN